jgi:small conductance mechanosensitive channel
MLMLVAGAIGSLLHWMIGRIHRRVARRIVPPPAEDGTETEQSLKRLLIDWTAKGAQTLVWLLYSILLLSLLPQTRSHFETVGERLRFTSTRIVDWLGDRGVTALVIIAVTIFLMRFAAAFIKVGFELVERRAFGAGAERMRRRSQTLSGITRGAAQAAIFFVGLMVLLQQLGINITPILASAGIVGIAVGFGAQSLVKDIFAGFLILLEDQYGVGDVIKVGEASGAVEHLTLRATWVRGLDGSLTTIPNGSINQVSNLSKEWSRAVLDVEVAYDEDLDRAMRVMVETARKMKEEMPREIIDEPVMLGVDKMTSESVVLRLAVKTAPAQQADMGRELRRRIKLAFDNEGIKAPPGRQHFVLASPPRERQAAALEQLASLAQAKAKREEPR